MSTIRNPQSKIRNPQIPKSRPPIPPAFLARMARLLGDEYGSFAASSDAPPGSGLHLNSTKISTEQFLQISPFHLEPLPWTSGAFLLPNETESLERGGPGKHPHQAAGLYYLQEPSAMVVAELLDPQPGERVLDLAAAPGGKATAIVSLMHNEGLLLANEIHGQRVWDLAENLERWGARNAVITNESPERLADRFAGTFDRVLLDAPCSGEGMFRKSDAARREWSPELVLGGALRQSHILAQAARLVCPGGRLVYSTCTFAPEENEGVIAQFLAGRPDFVLLEPPRRAGFGPGRPEWAPPETATTELRHAVRLWPHTGPGEGHFVAVLQRAAGSDPCAIPRWQPERVSKPIRRLYRAFCEEILLNFPDAEDLALSGAYLYAVPPGAPDLAGLRFIHPGWWLGILKKDRFEPSHALALGLSLADANPDRVVNLTSGGQEVLAYLRGESLGLPGPAGWTLVAVDGFPLGWGKRVAGVVKSHYPKGLRWT
jgi:16S rRNA C967 or C1407 C5-methylase (RsmB/RsmF family)/NOL1/NOP2/fmu family ribosome biogenesis protein